LTVETDGAKASTASRRLKRNFRASSRKGGDVQSKHRTVEAGVDVGVVSLPDLSESMS
jgi:hypothetical protein